MKIKKNNRSQKRSLSRIEARKKVATWTIKEFTKSFKTVRKNYFHIRIEKPTTDIEKVLFVTVEDLKSALEKIKAIDNFDESQVIKLDEKEINNAYEQIVK